MAIIGSRVVYLTVVGMQAGQQCFTTLPYASVDGVSGVRGRVVAETFISDVLPAWQAVASEQFQFVEVRYREAGPGQVPAGSIPTPATFGLVAGNVLPPFVTFSLYKVPDNATIEPSGAEDFGFGRLGISGVPEASQDNGTITSGALTLLETLASELVVLPVPAEPHQLFMIRPGVPGGAPTSVAFVFEIGFNKIGSQNTRKN